MNYHEFFNRISEDWKNKRPDWDMQDAMLILAALRCAFELEKRTEELYAKFDLNSATFGVLVTLYRSSPKAGMTPSELVKHVLVSAGSVTNRIDRLEERGLVVREYSSEDRRAQYIRLTKEGTKLLEKIMPLHLENEEKMLSGISSADKKKLKELLFKVMENFEI
ncbi:MarR family winged helix-turn-helix transcriptional regulator [Bdellovibrio sp. NC01]|uniref:MarR family winged helix-turn-helix transcriptional regulator n=1 Tax=Bdellovibrio sp. NC01 TaxID=2220073 RepID=UPI0011597B15|nr:MarR family transcriptional regulator [Bdellovibrio sp. NC01]QDK37068.1 hypothetical protein DOE51_05405 [Bdellovibrio sp. NC01]